VESRAVVLTATLLQVAIAIGKLVAAAVTGSLALLADGIRSSIDIADQVTFFRARRRVRPSGDGPRDAGDGSRVHYWPLVSSTLLFGAGAGACLALGLAWLVAGANGVPTPSWTLAVLGLSAIVEGASWLIGARKISQALYGASFWRFLRDSRDPALIAVVAQDTAALLGLLLAFAGILGDRLLGTRLLDPIAAICIGLSLGGVSLVLARERRTLLGNGGAGSESIQRLRMAIAQEPGVAAVGGIWTLQLGPDDLLVSCEIEFRGELLGRSAEEAIHRVERAARAAEPRASRVLVAVESSGWRATGAGTVRSDGTGTRLA
jgi:cation diffusion facilitator family transporter